MISDLEEKKNQGTDYFPFECYSARTEDDRFLVTYHWHRQTEMICVESGEVQLTVEGNTLVGGPGHVFCVNPGQLHQLALEKPGSSYFSIVFNMGWLDFKDKDFVQETLLDPLKKGLGLPLQVRPEDACHKILQRELLSIRQIYLMQPNCYRLMIKILLYKILLLFHTSQMLVPVTASAAMNSAGSAARLRELMEFIAAHYQEKITLEQGAEIMHMSPKYFSNFFTKTCLISFTQYINHYRIDQASIQLKTTDKPISDIAFDVGFENLSYFIRKFREVRGCTPKDYRRGAASVRPTAGPDRPDNLFQKVEPVLEEL